MSLKLYDEALLNKIKNWVKDENMTITSPDETKRLFSYIADVTDDSNIKLPLIALRRHHDIEIGNISKRPLTYDGKRVCIGTEANKLLNAIPITLNYQIDIYTRYQEEADEYLRNFLFNLINYPKLTIEIPYNDLNFKYNSNIRLNTTVSDTSDIPERMVPGQFSRFTIQFTIDDAYLFSVPVKKHINIDANSKLNVKIKEIELGENK